MDSFTNLVNDILIGEPSIIWERLGCISLISYINVMVTTRTSESLYSRLRGEMRSRMQARAEAAGAKGFRLIGCTCVGQDMQGRQKFYGATFAGHAGTQLCGE